MSFRTRLSYFADSAVRTLNADTSCPFDGSKNTSLIKRKHLVTALYGCQECGLRFRVPKESEKQNESFYQEEYTQGFTTDVPGDAELANLVATGFANSPKDYSVYIDVLRAAGVMSGQTIFDFGCSWGYGSWQLKTAGYKVYSYEISRSRARYAAGKLGCNIVQNVADLPEKVDCFFSAHVLEHLPDPKIFWQAVSESVKLGGTIIGFTPNGDPAFEKHQPEMYHKLWGKVHPLMITHQSYMSMALQYGCEGKTYSSPYDLAQIASGVAGKLSGDELLFVGRKQKGSLL